ncbi:uncharacterized protein [Asterias amurensis]|uniref:uncharacterized protein n=1 Tax=Asterias amurensis TaxID=7602 RepID=UPI003AB3AB6D
MAYSNLHQCDFTLTFRILSNMDLTSWFNRSLLVVSILCSLDTTQLFGVDSLSLHLIRLSPGGDIVEGDEVKLQCDVDRLAPSHVIEWVRVYMDVGVIIAWNGTSLDQRYELQTFRPMSTSGISIQEVFIIKNISRTDESITCRINDIGSEMMSGNLPSGNINLNVYYFPSPMYPICFPDGPFTVQEGTLQHLSCTTEKGNPTVNMELLPTPSTAILLWMFSDINNKAKGFINLTLDETYNGYQFQCIITSDYFTGRRRSCTIGPITATNMTTDSNEDAISTDMRSGTKNPNAMITDHTSLITSTDISNCHCCELCESNEESINTSPTPWLVAFIIILILFIVSLIINIFFLIKHRHLKITKEKETNVAKADPYMELQPTEDKNKVYMEPTTATTTTQDTYYQPVEVETDSHEYEYARPEGSTNSNTDYEAVSKPQSTTERPYQDINN